MKILPIFCFLMMFQRCTNKSDSPSVVKIKNNQLAAALNKFAISLSHDPNSGEVTTVDFNHIGDTVFVEIANAHPDLKSSKLHGYLEIRERVFFRR